MQNRLTIKDIARMSGVGKSTVSRVLNNEGSVSPQTRERVEAVIRQHGFTLQIGPSHAWAKRQSCWHHCLSSRFAIREPGGTYYVTAVLSTRLRPDPDGEPI